VNSTVRITKEKGRLLQLLSNGVVELRCFDKANDRVWSGLFDDYRWLSQAIKFAMRGGWDVYHTQNPVDLPATNAKLRPYQKTTRDNQISCYKTLLIDMDAKEPGSDGATWEQIEAIQDSVNSVIEFLMDNGFAKPSLGFSGNGYHIIYNTYIPVTESKKIRDLLLALKKRWPAVDGVVYNPSRIARCMGTTNSKGGQKSEMLVLSDEVTDGKTILDLAKRLTPVKKKTWVRTDNKPSSGKWVDCGELLNKFMEEGMFIREGDAGKYYVLCPNHNQHSSTGETDTLIFWDGERGSFHCSHDHCQHLKLQQVASIMGEGNDIQTS